VRQRNLTREASHKARLLKWAIAGNPLHADDWYVRGADGGSAIKALRSRIPELERDGYGFHHRRLPDGTIEYRLAYVGPAPVALVEDARPPHSTGEPERLFEPPAAPPLNAALTDWGDAV
jgi:hypothetical protein